VRVDAILWDYDGTLINSVPKNISVTKSILEEVAPHLSGLNLPSPLKSQSAYQVATHGTENWRDMYLNHFGLTEDQTDAASSLWHPHQLKNDTPVKPFDGIIETVKSLSHVPQGICSLNSAENISQVLREQGIEDHFTHVIGHDDVPFDRQKPAPDVGILCLSKMFASLDKLSLFYIGDHQTDTKFARNLQQHLGDKAKVYSVAVTYSGASPQDWSHKPDWIIDRPEDILDLVGP